jgi:hypothetical protein
MIANDGSPPDGALLSRAAMSSMAQGCSWAAPESIGGERKSPPHHGTSCRQPLDGGPHKLREPADERLPKSLRTDTEAPVLTLRGVLTDGGECPDPAMSVPGIRRADVIDGLQAGASNRMSELVKG